MTQFKFFIEIITHFTNSQITASYNEQDQYVDFYRCGKMFHIQFRDGEFEHGEILRYKAKDDGYVSEKYMSDAYTFLAEI